MSVHNPHLVTGQFINPERAVSHFHLRDGDVVGDFGAGVGNFTIHLAKAVGERGSVYALEIQKSLLTKLGDTARSHNLTNINVLWCDLEAERGTKHRCWLSYGFGRYRQAWLVATFEFPERRHRPARQPPWPNE